VSEPIADNPLWCYSLAVYRGPVARLCLNLQDRCGADVNLLLYAAWLADRGHRLTAQHLAIQERAVAPWRERVLKPLRALRRALDDYAPAASLRAELLRLELEAERRQQDALFLGYRRAAPARVEGAHLAANLSLVAQRACDEARAIQGRELTRKLAAQLAREAGVASPRDG